MALERKARDYIQYPHHVGICGNDSQRSPSYEIWKKEGFGNLVVDHVGRVDYEFLDIGKKGDESNMASPSEIELIILRDRSDGVE